MIGVVAISHGGMSTGIKSSAHVLLGEDKPQFEAVELLLDDSPEVFFNKLNEAVAKVDTGDGVIVFADLFGGTPCNQSINIMSDRIKLVSGMNFPMIIEVLCSREFKGGIEEFDLDELVAIGQDGIKDVFKALS